MTSYNRLNGIVKLPNQVTHDLMKMGVWDANKIELNKMGGIKRFLGNPLINSQLFSQSPVDYYEKMILPIYQKNNYTEDQIQRENALIFGRTGGKMFNLIDKQMGTIHHSVDSYDKARGLNSAYGAVGGTYNGKMIDFQKKWENLQLVMVKDGGLLDTFTKGLEGLTSVMQLMTDIAHKNPVDGVIHLMDSGSKPMSGDMLCFELYGERAVGKLMGQSIITSDGEALEAAAMEDIVVLGKVTFMVSNYHEDSRPII
ncbi:hypothetical protein [Pantoea agglomerans]